MQRRRGLQNLFVHTGTLLALLLGHAFAESETGNQVAP